MKRPGWLLLGAWLVAFAACRGVESVGAPCGGGGASAGPPPAPQPAPQLGHVFIVVEENTDCGHVIGNPGMPYLNSLANQYSVAGVYWFARLFRHGMPGLPITRPQSVVSSTTMNTCPRWGPRWGAARAPAARPP